MPPGAALLLALLAGSLAYCALVVLAAWRYLAVRPLAAAGAEPVSILKPLSGIDEGLEENLRSFFVQEYPAFEILFAVRQRSDPAAAMVDKLCREYPEIPARLIVTGEPPCPNAKVYALERMLGEARYDLIVMSDSDVRVTRGMLRVLSAEFQDERIGLATCPYRAVGGRSFWSELEALGMNTEFLAGVLVARMIEGMRFGVGPTMAARRRALDSIGGFPALKDYLAEDFMMGRLMAEAGWEVILSSYVIEHRIGTQPLRANLLHRLRWARSTRRSRPWGYLGQVFTFPLPPALLLLAVRPAWWGLALVAALARAAAAWATAEWVLHDPLTRRKWWLVPVQDLAGFLLWAAGFFGNTVTWRRRRYRVSREGKLLPVGGASKQVRSQG